MLKATLRRLLVLLAIFLATATSYAQEASRKKTVDQLFAEVAKKVPGFGGMFFEKGALHVYLQQPSDLAQRSGVEEAIAEVFGRKQIPAGGIRILRGDYGFSQLEDWHRRANAVLSLPGVTMTDNDERKNRVTIGLETMEARAQVERELAGLGIPLQAVNFENVGPFETVAELRDRIRPVVGGVQIRFQRGLSGFLCTLGFVATLPGVPDTPGFVTNSHCTAERGVVEGTTYWQPTLPDTNLIGTEILDPPFFTSAEDPACPVLRVCRYSDSAFASLSDDGNRGELAQTALGSLVIEGGYRIVARHFATVGETLDKVGRTTGRTEGLVLNTCISSNVSGTNITMLCQDRVQAGVGAGDSGSPVFAITDTPLPNDVELAGILWGSSGATFVYSPIANVELELGALGLCDPLVGCVGDP